ncbi:MAG: PEP-CTERM sorting domain-containing protein [Planctomycetota bacterium]
MKRFCTAVLFCVTGAAGASGAIANGSFEADAVGVTTEPTGFSRDANASSVIVDTNVTDGSNAVQVTVDYPAGGFGGTYFSNALTQFRVAGDVAAELISGEDYTIRADVTVETADSVVTIQGFSSGLTLINDSVDTAADTTLIGVTQTVSADFTYAGGDLFVAIQTSDPNFDGGAVTVTVDNFQIVPEPGTMMLGAMGGGLCLLRRRRA